MKDLWLIKKFKRQKNPKSLSAPFLSDDLQTLAHVRDKLNTVNAFCGQIGEKQAESYWQKKQKLLQEKLVWITRFAFNSNESKSVTCT